MILFLFLATLLCVCVGVGGGRSRRLGERGDERNTVVMRESQCGNLENAPLCSYNVLIKNHFPVILKAILPNYALKILTFPT